jgi:hypothetical protein
MFVTGSICFPSTIVTSVKGFYPYCVGQLQSLEYGILPIDIFHCFNLPVFVYIHPVLVLHPNCIPEKVGIIQKGINEKIILPPEITVKHKRMQPA